MKKSLGSTTKAPAEELTGLTAQLEPLRKFAMVRACTTELQERHEKVTISVIRVKTV
jgi:hypothetical protein